MHVLNDMIAEGEIPLLPFRGLSIHILTCLLLVYKNILPGNLMYKLDQGDNLE